MEANVFKLQDHSIPSLTIGKNGLPTAMTFDPWLAAQSLGSHPGMFPGFLPPPGSFTSSSQHHPGSAAAMSALGTAYPFLPPVTGAFPLMTSALAMSRLGSMDPERGAALGLEIPPPTGGIDPRSTSIAALRMKAQEHAMHVDTLGRSGLLHHYPAHYTVDGGHGSASHSPVSPARLSPDTK